jgi:hypothetical protein
MGFTAEARVLAERMSREENLRFRIFLFILRFMGVNELTQIYIKSQLARWRDKEDTRRMNK